jgi:hypothetical protein
LRKRAVTGTGLTGKNRKRGGAVFILMKKGKDPSRVEMAETKAGKKGAGATREWKEISLPDMHSLFHGGKVTFEGTRI